MNRAEPSRRWYRLTPGRFVAGLLVAECLLWLSDRAGWPAWHKGYAVLTCVAIVGAAMIGTGMWFVAALVLRRRFQFGIRTLLALTLVVAFVCSWFVSELKQAKRQQSLVDEIAAAGGGFGYDYEFDPDGRPLPSAQPPGPMWLRRLVTDDFIVTPVQLQIYEMKGDVLSQVGQLATLQRVGIWGADVSAQPFKAISHLSQLRELDFYSLDYSREIPDLERIQPMPNLRSLSLDDWSVSDTACQQIVWKFPSLREIRIYNSYSFVEICPSDKGLAAIRMLPCLERLDVKSGELSFGCVETFSNCASIRELSLSHSSSADREVRLRNCVALEKLELASNRREYSIAVERLPKLRELRLECADVTWCDDTSAIEKLSLFDCATPASSLAAFVARCPRLTEADFADYRHDPTPVLRQLVKNTALRKLNLSGTTIADAGLEQLKAMPTLERLEVGRTSISDAGLIHLQGVRRLEYVDLNNTRVTDAGVQRLQQAMPSLEIRR
jgi:hypothetical protein